MSMNLASLPNAKTGKDLPQQVVAGELTRNGTQIVVRQPKPFRKQVKRLIAVACMLIGQNQMATGVVQCPQMPFSGKQGRFSAGIPTRYLKQFPAQTSSEERRAGNECVSTCRYRWSR